jgi:hypothetical protein
LKNAEPPRERRGKPPSRHDRNIFSRNIICLGNYFFRVKTFFSKHAYSRGGPIRIIDTEPEQIQPRLPHGANPSKARVRTKLNRVSRWAGPDLNRRPCGHHIPFRNVRVSACKADVLSVAILGHSDHHIGLYLGPRSRAELPAHRISKPTHPSL